MGLFFGFFQGFLSGGLLLGCLLHLSSSSKTALFEEKIWEKGISSFVHPAFFGLIDSLGRRVASCFFLQRLVVSSVVCFLDVCKVHVHIYSMLFKHAAIFCFCFVFYTEPSMLLVLLAKREVGTS